MTRPEFEELRDLPGKVIEGNVRFALRSGSAHAVVSEPLPVQNALGVDLRLTITFNRSVGSKTFNVHVPGVGPICRLDVDGVAHRPAGRSHKHSLRTERCPGENLPLAPKDRPDLSGLPLRELFVEFCRMARIEHRGAFEAP